jgi:hypothetical protein
MKFGAFLKKVFVSKFWIKAISLLLAVFVVILLNIG